MMRKCAVILMVFLGILGRGLSQVEVSLAWQQDTIELGNETDLILSVLTRSNEEIVSVSMGFLDSLISGFQTAKMREGDSTKMQDFAYADADVLDIGQFTIVKDDGLFAGSELNWERSQLNSELLLTNKFRIRLWDPGQIVALTPEVVYASGEELFKNTVKRQASLYVRPPVDIEAMQQDSLNISPIKDIIKEPIKWSDYLIYVYIIGALATLALLYFFYQRYRSGDLDKVDVVEEVYVPAHRKALDKLYGLNEKQLWQSGKIKEYQTELTDIVREYLENRYQVRALESTTDEIIYDLKRQNLTSDQITELRNILQVADLVKFAKSKPDISIHQEFMDKSVDFVQSTKEKPLVEEV